MARTHTFKGSASAGYGYFAYIEDGQLVIGEDWGRDGGVLYRGAYRDSTKYLNMLRVNAPKLFNGIVQYYAEQAKKEETMKMANKDPGVTYVFKNSCDSRGNGYSGCIKNGQLVLEYDDPRNGGCYFRGSYEEAVARGHIAELKDNDLVLYCDIEKYFSQKRAKTELEKFKKDCGFDEETKTILFKVKIYNKNGVVHNCLVRGRFQADAIKKLMPSIPEVLTIQTATADVFAIRSSEISAVEFVDDFYASVTVSEAVGIK